jgi:hypothetical protein
MRQLQNVPVPLSIFRLPSHVLVMFGHCDRFIYMMMRFMEMLQNPRLKPFRGRVVLFLAAIANRPVENFTRLVQSSSPRPVRIYRFMVFQTLSVFDGRHLQFLDGFIYLMNCIFFLLPEFSAIRTLQQRPRESQVRKRMQVVRMVPFSQQFLRS